MMKYLTVVFCLLVFAIPAMAQIYNDKEQVVKAPFDRVVEETHAVYYNTPIAGADQDVKPQDVRYEEMTNAVNEANEKHFNMVVSE